MLSNKTPQPKWAHQHDVVAGDTLTADGGFTCISSAAALVVEADGAGRLFVPCAEGRHYLDGQLEEGNVYIGFTKADGVPLLSPGQPAAESGAC